MKHIISIHEGKKEQHKCSICDYTPSQKGYLKTHIRTVHEGIKPHKCLICAYTASQKVHLKRHINSINEKK